MKNSLTHLRALLSLACIATWAPTASAADGAIVTDRPDFVESSDVVPPGRLQLETSLAFERERQPGMRARLSATPTLLRIGVAENWELRFETDGRLRLSTSAGGLTNRQRGWADLSFGVKWHQRSGDAQAGTPGLGWLLHVDTDSGSGAFRGQGMRPSLRMVAEWELPGGWAVGVMPGLYRDRNEDGRRFIGGIFAAVAGKSLTDRLRGFVEIAGQQLASARNGASLITLNSGLAYLLQDDLQLDAALSRGLNKNAPDLAMTVGLSARF